MDGRTAASVLTPALAQEIAGSTTDIIGFNVLITDRDGTVIGSGDRTRVGSFHEASVEVMHTLRAATHSAAQARILRGVRPGITLPIVLGSTALGTVGITGSPGQVRRFGLVVQRQTEILLQESVLLRSRLLRERALEDLVRDIAYYDPQVVEPDLIAYRAGELGYDLNTPRAVVVIDLDGPGDGALQTLRGVFTPARDIVAPVSPDRFVALHRLPATRRPDGHLEYLRRLCRKTVDDIAHRHTLTATIGTGTRATTVAELHVSYQDAVVALRLGARIATRGDTAASIHSIDNLRVHQLLAAAGHGPRTRLIESLTADLRTQPDWPVLRPTLLAWCESGFNLVQAAAALHIHRNTLVYRLGKIARRTGHERDHRAMLALYLACLAEQIHDAD
jgi:carbohydrate diacid regulator